MIKSLRRVSRFRRSRAGRQIQGGSNREQRSTSAYNTLFHTHTITCHSKAPGASAQTAFHILRRAALGAPAATTDHAMVDDESGSTLSRRDPAVNDQLEDGHSTTTTNNNDKPVLTSVRQSKLPTRPTHHLYTSTLKPTLADDDLRSVTTFTSKQRAYLLKGLCRCVEGCFGALQLDCIMLTSSSSCSSPPLSPLSRIHYYLGSPVHPSDDSEPTFQAPIARMLRVYGSHRPGPAVEERVVGDQQGAELCRRSFYQHSLRRQDCGPTSRSRRTWLV